MSTGPTRLQNLLTLIETWGPQLVQWLITLGILKLPTPLPVPVPANATPAEFHEHVKLRCADHQVEVDQTALKGLVDKLNAIAGQAA